MFLPDQVAPMHWLQISLGLFFPEMVLHMEDSNLAHVGVPTRSRLIFRGVTHGEGMAMDALTKGFFG